LAKRLPGKESLMKTWKANGRSVASLSIFGAIVVLLAFGLGAAGAGASLEDEEIALHVRQFKSKDGFVVAQAIRGAYRRLADSRCQAVFSDFAKASGERLQQVLDEQAQTGQSHLRRLLFYDAAHLSGCRVPGVLAFTEPGSRVVFICSSWFREAFELNPAKVEAVIIHESLHSLGLAENPPRSQEITARVMARCGG
jgi:hypothetical protein